jgi:hypothetical protein
MYASRLTLHGWSPSRLARSSGITWTPINQRDPPSQWGAPVRKNPRLRLCLWWIIRNPFWIMCESREHSPVIECYEWFYHSMRNLRKPTNFDVTSGFVSMSDMFSDACTFLYLCCPFIFHLENDSIWWRCVLFWVCFVMDHFLMSFIWASVINHDITKVMGQ